MCRNALLRVKNDTRGASAVEFAIVAPVFMMLVLGIIGYGSYLATVHSVQQLAAEAARASVAGVSDSERTSLAQSAVDSSIASYSLLKASRLSVASATTDVATSTFTVTLRYNANDNFIFALPQSIPMPSSTIARSAAIQRGGY